LSLGGLGRSEAVPRCETVRNAASNFPSFFCIAKKSQIDKFRDAARVNYITEDGVVRRLFDRSKDRLQPCRLDDHR